MSGPGSFPSWSVMSSPKPRIGPSFCRCSRVSSPSTPSAGRSSTRPGRSLRRTMDPIETPQSRCRAGLARADITPPVGIYHRLWGAALHDRSTGVHRPLLATALWLEPLTPEVPVGDPGLLLALDHCLLDQEDVDRIRHAVGKMVPLRPEQVQVTMSHTHGSGWMSRSRAQLPGGELIGP